MDVYYHVEFQLCITSGSKVSRGVQNCTHPGIGCVQTPPGIGLTERRKFGANPIVEAPSVISNYHEKFESYSYFVS